MTPLLHRVYQVRESSFSHGLFCISYLLISCIAPVISLSHAQGRFASKNPVAVHCDFSHGSRACKSVFAHELREASFLISWIPIYRNVPVFRKSLILGNDRTNPKGLDTLAQSSTNSIDNCAEELILIRAKAWKFFESGKQIHPHETRNGGIRPRSRRNLFSIYRAFRRQKPYCSKHKRQPGRSLFAKHKSIQGLRTRLLLLLRATYS